MTDSFGKRLWMLTTTGIGTTEDYIHPSDICSPEEYQRWEEEEREACDWHADFKRSHTTGWMTEDLHRELHDFFDSRTSALYSEEGVKDLLRRMGFSARFYQKPSIFHFDSNYDYRRYIFKCCCYSTLFFEAVEKFSKDFTREEIFEDPACTIAL